MSQFLRRFYHGFLRLLRLFLPERYVYRFILFCDRVKYKGFLPLMQFGRKKKNKIITGGTTDKSSGLSLPFGNDKRSTIVPPWLVQEVEALSEIEPALYPTKEILERYSYWQPSIDNYVAMLYKECVSDFVSYKPDIIFIIPYLARGGADLGIIHHVRLCHEQGMKATIVITRDDISPWLNRLPEGARVIEFGRITRSANDDDRRLVLLRLLLQSQAKRIHLINSLLGWEVVEHYGKSLVSEGKKIYASLFCDDINEKGLRCGYASEFLPKTWTYLTGILSDNAAFLRSLHARDGIPLSIMHTVHFPNETPQVTTYHKGGGVLWASRITPQKRPELLYQIAKEMPNVPFDVYGESDRRGTAVLNRFKHLNNVTLYGRYDSFSEIVQRHPYSLFLYTSQYDGLPNVLLEATAAGLPIVTADVGGISELVNKDTGYLLPATAKVTDFVETLFDVLQNPRQAEKKMRKAQELLMQQHSLAAFRKAVAEVPGYLR